MLRLLLSSRNFYILQKKIKTDDINYFNIKLTSNKIIKRP